MKRAVRDRAFTLVEVVIALAVVSISLVVLLGLFSTGLVSSRKANNDTNLSAIVWQVASSLRSQTAANLTFPTNYYFDINGESTNNANTATYYKCAINAAPSTFDNAITNSANPPAYFAAANFTNVQLLISYPGNTYTTYVTIPPP